MRLTQKKIEDIIVGLLGEDGLPLVKQLYSRENVSEFDLATRTKKDIKVIRKMLYSLYNRNLVGFTRKKDKQKGWYVYYWTLLPESVRYNYIKRKEETLELIKQQIIGEEKELYFTCPTKCVRLNFDQSTDFEFHCPECGELISPDDKKERNLELERQSAQLQQEIKEAREVKKVHRKERVKKIKTKIKKKKITVRKKAAKKSKK